MHGECPYMSLGPFRRLTKNSKIYPQLSQISSHIILLSLPNALSQYFLFDNLVQ